MLDLVGRYKVLVLIVDAVPARSFNTVRSLVIGTLTVFNPVVELYWISVAKGPAEGSMVS